MEDPKSVLEVLGELLAPLGSKRQKLALSWVEHEIQNHAIVNYVEEVGAPIVKDADGNETGGPLVWRIGAPSPLSGDETVFAMFLDDAGVVTVYSFQYVEIEGKTAAYFYRSLLFRPIHVHGPVHHNALLSELGQFIGEDEAEGDPEPVHANGNATP